MPGPSAPPVSCFPGAVMPECGNLPTQPPTSQPPCEGPNCIPQPVPRDPDTDDESECGFTDPVACVTEAIDSFFRDLVIGALNPLLELLGKTMLSTPDPSTLPGIGQAWTESWHLMLTFYGSIVVIAGLILMSYETLQTRYTIKEIAPRVVVGFLAGTLSLFLATKGIEIANAVSAAVMTDAINPRTAGKAMTDMVLGSLNGGQGWLLFIGLALAVMLVVLLLTFIVRIIVTILLIAVAPIALMWHALPHTEGVAVTWWKAYGLLLAIQILQAEALTVALRVFFTPGGFTVFGPTLNGLTNLLLCVALMWILIKIPFWCLQPLRSGGRSMLGSLVRGAIAYKTMGLLGGAGSLFGGKNNKSGPASRAHGRDRAPKDPAATREGQFMLPIRARRTPPAHRSPRLSDLPGRAERPNRPGPGQLSLFTASGSGDTREVSPNPRALPPDSLPGALPRDQLGLPITIRRDPGRAGRRSLADDLADRRPGMPPPMPQQGLLTADGRVNRNARPPAHLPRALIAPSTGMLPIHLQPAQPQPARRTLADDLAGPAPAVTPQSGPGLITPSGQINRAARAPRRPIRDAYTGNRPLASGQYPLPLGVRREPTPQPPAAANTAPAPKRRAGTQLPLPLDLPGRPGPKKK